MKGEKAVTCRQCKNAIEDFCNPIDLVRKPFEAGENYMTRFLFSPRVTAAYKALIAQAPTSMAEDLVMAYLEAHDRGLRYGATGYAIDERKRLISEFERGMRRAALAIPKAYW